MTGRPDTLSWSQPNVPSQRRQSSNMPLRQNHRVAYRQNSAEELMIRGNICLSKGNAEEAVQCYSRILYQVSSGHVPALLNRSLAYLLLGVPELAVTDAYRAGVAVQAMREITPAGSDRGQAACNYFRAEKRETESDVEWTSKRRRFIGKGWPHSPLASIVITDVPEVGMASFSHTRNSEVCRALEIRALYRLCGALYQCGEGARVEALGLVDDTKRKYKNMEDWERFYFEQIGTDILMEIVDEEGKNRDPQGLTSLVSNTPKEQQDRKAYAEKMKLRTASRKLEGYQWNTWEPELLKRDWQMLLRETVSRCTSNCIPRVMGYLDVYDGRSKPYVELAASRDIKAGELLVNEQTRSNVTTSIPEDIYQQFTQHCDEANYHCDSCAAKLIVPSMCPIFFHGSTVPVSVPEAVQEMWETSSGDTRASRDSDPGKMQQMDNSPTDGNIDPVLISQSPAPLTSHPPTNAANPTSNYPPPSPSSHVLTPEHFDAKKPQEFRFCSEDHIVPSCGMACLALRETYDSGLCHTPIESELRLSHLHELRVKPTADRKVHCLRDLLMLRVLALAFDTNIHPLHNDDITFATCGPNPETSNHNLKAAAENLDKGEPKPQNWSFNDNVIRPIHYLHQFFKAQDLDPFLRLEATDGWVINTLMSKIGTGMKVTHGPRHLKLYDEDGVLDAATSNVNVAWAGFINGTPRSEDEENKVWVASINPVFNMIRIADQESRWETPNCTVVQKEGLFVYAITDIPAGQALLRAADGPNGPGLAEGLQGEGVDNVIRDGLGEMDLSTGNDGEADMDAWGGQWDV